jgi:multiple sugar transport system permease protein
MSILTVKSRFPVLSSWWSHNHRLVFAYLLLITLAILFLFPFYLFLRNSLMSDAEIASFKWMWFSSKPNPVGNFLDVINNESYSIAKGLRNSALFAIFGTFGSLFFSSLAGYGLARVRYRWRNVVLYVILASMMIPAGVSLIPLYVEISAFKWINTAQGILVPTLFSAFNTFLFRQFYLGFPSELEDAGKVDGLDDFGIYRHLLLPNSLPILATLGILGLVGNWNSFLWPLMVGKSDDLWTMQVIISSYSQIQSIKLHEVFMSSLITLLPPLLVFVIFQKYVSEGIVRTGVKG